jgi:cyclopropane fatty-acyl-phospholipid synthase-like methyltransferase
MDAKDVAAYYDQNTRRFLRYGGSGETAAIHRQVWAPGISSSTQAFTYLNRFILEQVTPLLDPGTPVRLLDLGCGVGGTSTWLAQNLPAEMDIQITGVSNSPVQVGLASQRAEQEGLTGRCLFRQADFLDLTGLGLAPASCAAAFAIESFVHAVDAAGFLREVSRWLKPGGRLVLCDDFLASTTPQQAQPWLRRFERGWHLKSLLKVEQLVSLARSHGYRLQVEEDLTRYLRTFPAALLYPLAWLTGLPLRGAFWDNLAGGSALQVCQRRGWMRYMALVFERTN